MNQDLASSSPATLDIGRLLKESWDYLFKKPIEHIGAAFLVGVLSLVTLGILSGPLTVGYIRMIERQRRGEPIAIGQVFEGFEVFGSSFVTVLAYAVGVALASLLLIIPGLFLLVAWGFALWFVALEGYGASEALGASWQLLKSHAGSVVVLLLLAIVINALGSSVLLATLLTAPFGMIFMTLGFRELTQ